MVHGPRAAGSRGTRHVSVRVWNEKIHPRLRQSPCEVVSLRAFIKEPVDHPSQEQYIRVFLEFKRVNWIKPFSGNRKVMVTMLSAGPPSVRIPHRKVGTPNAAFT